MFQSALKIVLPLCLLACSSSPKLSPRDVPEPLHVTQDNTLAFELHARGVQIYTCQPKKDDATKYEWALKAPDAVLTEADGKEAGHHYAGPTWEARDGSKVMGKLEQKVDAPGTGNIPWLLLSAKSHEGKGRFDKVSFIQRVDTKGGKAPAEGCDAAHAGQEVRIDYEATYLFFVPGS
ncbi:MAG TPA: DUF3455 domain-containing protein [Polyangiaceae bacterium]|jgi:hypothetical protein|nr:DUF3455 domain-containing protein [Polyangiaceae bacterium]